MAKPFRHALSSARKYGGTPDDYLDIHQLMDSSKSAIADNRHRALTHNAWFIGVIIERVFGVTRTNSDGKVYVVRDIAEQHVLEDFGQRFIPTAQDYLQGIPYEDWMQNAMRGTPPSAKELVAHGHRSRSGKLESAESRTGGDSQGSVRRDAEGASVRQASETGVV